MNIKDTIDIFRSGGTVDDVLNALEGKRPESAEAALGANLESLFRFKMRRLAK